MKTTEFKSLYGMLFKSFLLRFYFIICLIFFHSNVFAQQYSWLINNTLVTNPDNNFTLIAGRVKENFDSLRLTLNTTDLQPGEKSFNRWYGFWSNRCSYPGVQPGGDLSASAIYLNKAAAGEITICNVSPNNNSWSQVGPITSSIADMGVVNALAMKPNDINTIYAGTQASGLWKTTNKGLNWNCISDGIKFPALGITGKIIFEMPLYKISGSFEINTSSYDNGLYFLQIYDDKKIEVVHKVIIQH